MAPLMALSASGAFKVTSTTFWKAFVWCTVTSNGPSLTFAVSIIAQTNSTATAQASPPPMQSAATPRFRPLF